MFDCLRGFYNFNMYFNKVFIKLIHSHSISSIGPNTIVFKVYNKLSKVNNDMNGFNSGKK